MSQHAIDNAKAWFQSIREMVAEVAASVEEATERYQAAGGIGGGYDDTERTEAARCVIEESQLGVLVRSGWYLPGSPAGSPDEYEILLTTGRPALRIVGDLNEHGEPESATLQWQDWGMPWTPLRMSELPCSASEADATLLSYASHFYFGE